MPPRLYLDVCVIKRPWDDQGQPRIAAETHGVLQLAAMAQRGLLKLVRSPAHDEENDRNTNPKRARLVADWLETLPQADPDTPGLAAALARANALGLTGFDAVHFAWASALMVDLLVTSDDRFIRRCARSRSGFRVLDPLTALAEVSR